MYYETLIREKLSEIIYACVCVYNFNYEIIITEIRTKKKIYIYIIRETKCIVQERRNFLKRSFLYLRI